MRILLHVCCGPCAAYPVKTLKENGHEITGYFYNPNIHPYKEFMRRLETTQEFAGKAGIELIADKEYELDAMVDSGNSLYDPVSGRPVAVAWLPETGDIPIPVGTVNERSVLYAFRPDSARLDGSDMDILVAVSKRPLRAALIPPAALCDELKITRLEGKYHA